MLKEEKELNSKMTPEFQALHPTSSLYKYVNDKYTMHSKLIISIVNYAKIGDVFIKYKVTLYNPDDVKNHMITRGEYREITLEFNGGKWIVDDDIFIDKVVSAQ